MNKEFVTYKQSLALKELGFDEPCFGYYENGVFIYWYDSKQENELLLNCTSPLKQQVFRWFREKYGLFTQPNRTIDTSGVWYYFSIATKRTDVCEGSFSYESAEQACLDKLIEICKNK
jgi:hypothetical protein